MNNISLQMIKTNIQAQLDGKQILPMCLFGNPGIGKEQPLYSRILTPNGWTTMGNIKVGDKVCSPNKTYNTVTAIHPQGVKDVYTVYFNDNTSVDCGLNHLWKVSRSTWGNEEFRTMSTKELLKLHTNNNVKYIAEVPLTIIEYPEANLPLHPYLLGALIGNGSLRKIICLSSHANQQEIIAKCNSLLPKGIISGSIHNISKNRIQQTFICSIPEINPLKDTLISLHLYKTYSYTKFIPQLYLQSSYDQRIQLLNGLMDTNGSASKSRNRSTYNTSSIQLARNIKELVYSLGGIAKITSQIRKNRRIEYRLQIQFTSLNPFTIVDKANKLTPHKQNGVRKCIVEIVKTDKQTEQQCISLDGDHLYITDGFTTTHNTSVCSQVAEQLNIGFINLSMPATKLEQFSGIPTFTPMKNLKQYSITNAENIQGTVWSAPEILVNANRIAEEKNGCLILLDDFHELGKNRAVMAIMYELLLERKLGDLKFHPKVAFISAMNHSEAAGFTGLPSAINDRLSLHKISYNHDYWLEHYGRYLHHFISTFVKGNANYVTEPESTSTESAGSPRSWTYFSNLLYIYDEQFIIDNALILAKQFMSSEAADAFNKHVQYIAAIDFTNIVKTKQLQKIIDLNFTEKVLWPEIIQYISTVEDAAYLVDLINYNADDDLFIGYLVAKFYDKYVLKERGQAITTAQSIMIEKLILDNFDIINYKLTTKEKKLIQNMKLKDQNTFFDIASKFIN